MLKASLKASLIFPVIIILSCACAAAAGPTVEEVTAALDHAGGQADVATQAAVLESMTAKSSVIPHVKENTQLTRAYYLLAEAEKDKAKKLSYLDKSLETCKHVFQYDPGNIHAMYWHSMALLLKADMAGGLSALRMVKEALRGLERVSEKDAAYDSAGAYRSRGKVLIEAPSWSFIGDKKKGLALLEKAKGIAPGCLVTRLYLAQAYVKNGRVGEARPELDYIIASPARSKDDLEVKEDARKLLSEVDGKAD